MCVECCARLELGLPRCPRVPAPQPSAPLPELPRIRLGAEETQARSHGREELVLSGPDPRVPNKGSWPRSRRIRVRAPTRSKPPLRPLRRGGEAILPPPFPAAHRAASRRHYQWKCPCAFQALEDLKDLYGHGPPLKEGAGAFCFTHWMDLHNRQKLTFPGRKGEILGQCHKAPGHKHDSVERRVGRQGFTMLGKLLLNSDLR
ncbi:hypothetical protein AAY473_040479 [Plecturocebus cupreus]